MSNDNKHKNVSEETLEIARLRQENEQLAEQLKRLVKVENRLYEYQQELDSQLKEYQKLYELNRKFNRNCDISDIFENAIHFIINDLEYERAVFFKKTEDSGVYKVCHLNGFYDEAQKDSISGLTIEADDPLIAPILCGKREYLICREDSREKLLIRYRSKFMMDEYLVYPVGSLAGTPALLVIGGTFESRGFFRTIADGKGDLLGVGNLVGLVSSTIENHISNQNMLKALKQERIAEAKYQNIFENAVEGIFQTAPEGRIISANPSIASMLGYENPEIMIYTVADFAKVLCDDPLKRKEMLSRLFRCDRLSGFEIQLRRKNGSRLWALLNARVSRDDKGVVTSVEGFLTDITALKKAEEDLRASREMLENVLNNFPGVVFWKDINSVYIGCNKNFSNGAGLAATSDIAGKTDFDLPWAASEADAYRADDLQVMKSRQSKLNIVETQLQADGSLVWFDTSKVPLYDSNGTVIGVLGISSDITQQKMAEKSLLKAREELVLKEKLAILGQLSGIVSHELRNPLGIINNAVYLLKLTLPDANKTTAEYLDIIKHEIDNSLRIITGLLDFARTKPPQASRSGVAKLVESSLRKCILPDNVQLKTEVADEAAQLMVDPQQIIQVLQNLITNGIQAMPDGGVLTVAERAFKCPKNSNNENIHDHQTLDMEQYEEFVEISVSDSGVGISPENMSKLFQPLFTTKSKGIGLGLVVCKNLIEANGGKIEVASEIGEGTVFKIVFPAVAAEEHS